MFSCLSPLFIRKDNFNSVFSLFWWDISFYFIWTFVSYLLCVNILCSILCSIFSVIYLKQLKGNLKFSYIFWFFANIRVLSVQWFLLSIIWVMSSCLPTPEYIYFLFIRQISNFYTETNNNFQSTVNFNHKFSDDFHNHYYFETQLLLIFLINDGSISQLLRGNSILDGYVF